MTKFLFQAQTVFFFVVLTFSVVTNQDFLKFKGSSFLISAVVR